MRIVACAISFAMLLPAALFTRPASAQNLPACNTQLMTRHGNQITMGLTDLSHMFDQKLRASHSKFTGLQLTAEGGNKLKVSGKNNGTPTSIIGPLQVAGSGAIKLHATQILKNGSHEKGLMGLFGKDLADYANFNKTQSLSARGNNLFIHPDPLLNVSGRVTGVSLGSSGITLTFASQPCR